MAEVPAGVHLSDCRGAARRLEDLHAADADARGRQGAGQRGPHRWVLPARRHRPPLRPINAGSWSGCAVRIIASIEDPVVIEKILTHIERCEAAGASPHAPRAPPATSDGDPQ